VVFVKQYSVGTEIAPPSGRESTHSPPEKRMTRSRTAGPKNQFANAIHMAVSIANWTIRFEVRMRDGAVK